MIPVRLPFLAAATAVIGPVLFSSAGSLGAPDEHRVALGDTLSEIALRYGVSVEEFAEANGIVDPDYILSGQVLLVPGGRLRTEAAWPWPAARRPGVARTLSSSATSSAKSPNASE